MDCLKSEKDLIPIVNHLTELSCCCRCILRFLGLQVADNEAAYKAPKDFLHDLVSMDKSNDTEETVDEPIIKKLKRNICPVCLDCFEQKTVAKIVESFGSLCIEDYKYNNFFFNISLPVCLAIRAHSMLLHLKEQFPEFGFRNLFIKKDGLSEGPLLEQPHKIFRVTASETIAKSLGKKYHPKSHLSLLIVIGYENDNLEISNMRNILKKILSKRNLNTKISRNNISEFLNDVDDKLFKDNFAVPPEVPDKEVLLEKVSIFSDPLYLGGRYLKFKRNVSQTPWIVDGVDITEHNVQDIIFDAVFKVLGVKKSQLTFTASGREDVDVRMLGTGRPFFIKIDKPNQREFSPEQLLEVEREIIQTELAAVTKLQIVYASELNKIKFGEAEKKKTYMALCKTIAPIKEVISAIDKVQEDLKISQLTPMRVLHRRTLMSRPKVIHKMTASDVPGCNDLFKLEVVTQAGTYVKELVHGDFERTQPNISSIVGHPTDIVALDCLDINLVWP